MVNQLDYTLNFETLNLSFSTQTQINVNNIQKIIAYLEQRAISKSHEQNIDKTSLILLQISTFITAIYTCTCCLCRCLVGCQKHHWWQSLKRKASNQPRRSHLIFQTRTSCVINKCEGRIPSSNANFAFHQQTQTSRSCSFCKRKPQSRSRFKVNASL